MIKKIGCERKYSYGSYNIIIGTLDKKNPNIFYVEFSTYLSGNNNSNENRDLLYNKLNYFLKNYNLKCDDFELLQNRNIVDVDIACINQNQIVRPHLTCKKFFCIKNFKRIHGFKTLYELLQPIINNTLIECINETIIQCGFTTHNSKK